MFSDLIYTKRIEKLRNTYENVGDIDLYVGMVMETPKDDALIGDTFLCLIGDTFARIKYGDRFFYDLEGQAGSFTIGTCIEITNLPFYIENICYTLQKCKQFFSNRSTGSNSKNITCQSYL